MREYNEARQGKEINELPKECNLKPVSIDFEEDVAYHEEEPSFSVAPEPPQIAFRKESGHQRQSEQGNELQ